MPSLDAIDLSSTFSFDAAALIVSSGSFSDIFCKSSSAIFFSAGFSSDFNTAFLKSLSISTTFSAIISEKSSSPGIKYPNKDNSFRLFTLFFVTCLSCSCVKLPIPNLSLKSYHREYATLFLNFSEIPLSLIMLSLATNFILAMNSSKLTALNSTPLVNSSGNSRFLPVNLTL